MGVGVQIQEVPGWAPSCCGLILETGLDSDPSWLPEMAPGLGRVQAEASLPSEGQEWTSLRGEPGMCGSSEYPQVVKGDV